VGFVEQHEAAKERPCTECMGYSTCDYSDFVTCFRGLKKNFEPDTYSLEEQLYYFKRSVPINQEK